MKRRRYLATTAALASIAGCLGTGKPKVAEDPWISQSTDSGLGSSSRSGAFELPKGRFIALKYEPEDRLEFSYDLTVKNGGKLDVYVLEETAFTNYKEGTDFEFYEKLSSLSTTAATATDRLDPGSYRLLIDNTSVGEANSGNTITGSVTIEASIL